MEAKNLKIEVFVKTKTNKATKHDFVCYSCKMKDGKWKDLKFTKDVDAKLLPQSHSYIFVKPENINLDKRTKYVKVWVKGIEKVEVISRPLEDLEQYFDTEDDNA